MSRLAEVPGTVPPPRSYAAAMEYLVQVVQELSLARSLGAITAIVRHAARVLTGADGATFVLRDEDRCYYADEEAIAPLWKDRRFPMSACISGWAMLNRRQAVIEDIYQDPRIPHEAYRPTFVKSLVMVPIRTLDPIGAIGTYWATVRSPSEQEVKLLQALADTTAVAMENVAVYEALEQRVSDRTAQLEAANKELEAFSYSVSHDLRAPVRAVTGFCRLLEEDHDGALDEEARRKIGVISSEAGRLGTMIDGLLNFSRLGRASLEPVDVDMTAMVREIFDRVRDERPVELRLQSLPLARGDRGLLEHVWTNLLSNAVKFSQRTAEPVVEVSGRREEAQHVYVVRDNGAGFEPGQADRLFDVFQRLHHADEFPGTGVGLALVQRIVARHGGTVWADGAPGAGATFAFALPTG